MTSLPAAQLIEFAYMAAAFLFMLSLKWLSSPVSARHGAVARLSITPKKVRRILTRAGRHKPEKR